MLVSEAQYSTIQQISRLRWGQASHSPKGGSLGILPGEGRRVGERHNNRRWLGMADWCSHTPPGKGGPWDGVEMATSPPLQRVEEGGNAAARKTRRRRFANAHHHPFITGDSEANRFVKGRGKEGNCRPHLLSPLTPPPFAKGRQVGEGSGGAGDGHCATFSVQLSTVVPDCLCLNDIHTAFLPIMRHQRRLAVVSGSVLWRDSNLHPTISLCYSSLD